MRLSEEEKKFLIQHRNLIENGHYGKLFDCIHTGPYYVDRMIPRIIEFLYFDAGINIFLKMINVPAFAFFNTYMLHSISLPSNIEFIGRNAFANCSELTEVTIPPTVERIPIECFRDCVQLHTVKISEGVECIGANAFGGCSSLHQIYLPETVTQLGGKVFKDCSSDLLITTPKRKDTYEEHLYFPLDEAEFYNKHLRYI